MQKKRSRKNGTAADGPAPAGRRVRVRRRLVVGVAVAGLTVLAAGAPAVVSATAELGDSQRLVTRAQQSSQALTLAHLLGDERDAVVEYAAKGRPGAARGAVQERADRTDRQLAEVQADADEEVALALARVQAVRTEAVDGKGTALAAHQAYAGVIAELLAPGDRLAELVPPRATAAHATTRPLTPLGQAVEQASATRGLLLAALAVPRGEPQSATAAVDELTAAAQRTRVREQAALDDFARAAGPGVRQTLAATVTGPEVKAADDTLKRLADRPTLNAADRKIDGATIAPALTARIDRMRSVESTLAAERATALASLRDEDVTALEIAIALVGVLFLLTVGVCTAVARSLTRPLSVLRRGAARLATPEGSVEPVRFTGRNDEFAEVVHHLNAVRDQTVSLHTRIAGLDADRRRLIGRNEALTASRETLEKELSALRSGLEEHRRIMSTTSVSLSLRTLGLVERQLAVIEELESKEQDPDRLATLFKLDHLATVMRRHNENLLVLAGQEHGHGQGTPVPLVDVMRAAVSEIERYERVDLAALPPYTQVAGHAADDISHVLAELLENATTFSPPDAKVKVSGWVLDSGDVALRVVDEGIGITEDRLESLNARLSSPEAYDEEPEAEHGLGLGLYVAGRLAARHGVTAELRASRGGTEALVLVPAPLLPVVRPESPVHALATPGTGLRLPGVIAEANENTLPARLRRTPDQAAPATAPPAPPAHPEQQLPYAEPEPLYAEPRPYPGPDQPAAEPGTQPRADSPYHPDQPVYPYGEPRPAPAAQPPAEPAPGQQLLDRIAPGTEPEEPAPAGVAAYPPAGVPAAPGVRPPAPEPDPHHRTTAEESWLPRQGGHPEEAVTDKGLPKRTPRVVAAGRADDAAAPPAPPRRVDPEELRRRLGGFYQGAQDGRRVVAAELSQDRPQDHGQEQHGQTDQGDTAQEART
ncbi:nitrate- and nitrite sensing domain-containing protein [Streptomyces sp. NPDC051567]|uniref:nitrate- and nitrite sensing domain-containing protein n=1 Tax=Streptomyces sp. NPDC051567 TaxID=3365660 RepID=UPI00379CA3A0